MPTQPFLRLFLVVATCIGSACGSSGGGSDAGPQATPAQKTCCRCLSNTQNLSLGQTRATCESRFATGQTVLVGDQCRIFEQCEAECSMWLRPSTCPDANDRACCQCLVAADLTYTSDSESCAADVGRGDDPLRPEMQCTALDVCPDCVQAMAGGTRPQTCGEVDACCACLSTLTYSYSGTTYPCLETSANSCAVRVRAGEDIPLHASYRQQNIDQCLIDGCRMQCKGYPPSP